MKKAPDKLKDRQLGKRHKYDEKSCIHSNIGNNEFKDKNKII